MLTFRLRTAHNSQRRSRAMTTTGHALLAGQTPFLHWGYVPLRYNEVLEDRGGLDN